MSINPCNFTAPGTGKPSNLAAGLYPLLGERTLHAWYKIQRFVPRDAEVPRDENGEPTLDFALKFLGLGSPIAVAQHMKFASRWHLKPVSDSLTVYHGSLKLAQKMRARMEEVNRLYNALVIRYNYQTGYIEVAPAPGYTLKSKAADKIVEKPSPKLEALKKVYDAQQAKALAEASKPFVKLPFITDTNVLGKMVTREVEVEETGEIYEQEIRVAKAQAQLKREYKILEKLLNCIK